MKICLGYFSLQGPRNLKRCLLRFHADNCRTGAEAAFFLRPLPRSWAMSAAQGLALKLRAAPTPGGRRGRTTVRAAGAAHAGALQHRRCCVSSEGGRFLRGSPLPAAQQRPRPLPSAQRAARRHDGGVVASAGVRSMSKIPQTNLGLYDPAMDRDSCGVGFIAELSAEPGRKTVSTFGATRALLGVYSSLLKLSGAPSSVCACVHV